MLKKITVLLILIVCKSTVALAGYGSAENRALNLDHLVFSTQYKYSDLLTSYPIDNNDEKKKEDVKKSKESNAGGSSDSSSSVSRTTSTQGSLQNQHTDDEGDDKPPLPPKEDKKEPCGAECLPFSLRKVVQVGQAPISFIFKVKREDLMVISGNSPWGKIALTQGSSFVQITLRWYYESNQLSLWPAVRTSAPSPKCFMVVLGSNERPRPTLSSDFINLTGEFPSNSQNVLSELQVEIQLLDDSDQVLSNMFFSDFDLYTPRVKAYNPLGVNGYDMCNHQGNDHGDFYDSTASATAILPFPDCNKCQSIANAEGAYKNWLDYLNKYIKGHEILKLRVIIKSIEPQPPVTLNSAQALADHNRSHHSGERTCTQCQPPVTLNGAKALDDHKFRKHRKRKRLAEEDD